MLLCLAVLLSGCFEESVPDQMAGNADVAPGTAETAVAPPAAAVPAVAAVVAPVVQLAGLPNIDRSKIPAPVAGFQDIRIQPTQWRHGTAGGPTKNLNNGDFRTGCTMSHMAFDDPIVYPGQKGAAHLHMFWGNTGSDFSSTTSSLMNSGGSTCVGGIGNRTSYWIPALIDTVSSAPQTPVQITMYYKSHSHPTLAEYVAPPTGLRMVVGKQKSDWDKPGAGTDTLLRIQCKYADGSWGEELQYIPACPPGNDLFFMIGFYGCWDGVNLDSPDHRSHMSNATDNGRCPASHPVPIPGLTLNIYYKVPTGADTTKWRLSSDAYAADKPGGYSVHADVWFAWNERVASTWIQRCIRDGFDCHGNLLGDDTELF